MSSSIPNSWTPGCSWRPKYIAPAGGITKNVVNTTARTHRPRERMASLYSFLATVYQPTAPCMYSSARSMWSPSVAPALMP
jgi:hypothetical protein